MELGNLDDLPKYSPWPKRLLGFEPWLTKVKTPEEIDREFGREKWGALLERFRQNPDAKLADVDEWAAGDAGQSLTTVGEHLVLMTAEESHSAYIAYIADAVEKRLPASAIVELGCGYGSVINALAKRPEFQGMDFQAADFTKTGPELAGLIAENEGVQLRTGHCDFTSGELTELDIPPGAIVYTAYAAQYVEELGPHFVEGLIALEPRAVVHIEPVYEHATGSTLLGLLRRRYIEANGYNRNLSTVLHDHEARGSLEILEETAPAFGPNPLLAASVIAWKPRG
jgi:hypothetical protein